MEKDRNKDVTKPSGNIEEILRERERLERVLREKFKKELTILFSDISGYTHHMDTRGDISGRALLQRHNDIVLPLIEENHGTLIKTIGDAVMASFPTSLNAVKAAMAVQQRLNQHNQGVDPADQIRVKIGVNSGEALVDDMDVYGDVVNVASRIQCKAASDEILISESVYNQVCGSEDILCRWHGKAALKGKAQAIELYRVVWRDDDILADIPLRVRAYEAEPERKTRQPVRVLLLEVAREGDRLKISAHEQMAGEASTIRHYEEIPVSMDWIGKRCREMVETLNNANRKGRLSREVLVRLREIGQIFYDELFTPGVKNKLQKTRAECLTLYLDDQLVHVPWELLYDGQAFLCRRFAMGRLVKTRQAFLGVKSRLLARPLKALVLADPKGDLKGAYREGKQIRDYMDHSAEFVNVTFSSDNVTPDFIKEKMRNFDLVHFAGHADYDAEDPGQSGWGLSEGLLTAQNITKMAGAAAMPALIFSNACQSARTEEWTIREYFQHDIFGLANAFLLAGVKHYVGTFWEILDEPSSHFALEFYKQLLSGTTIGEAMQLARSALIRSYGEESIVWASYLLYGDPAFNYMDQIHMLEPAVEPEPVAAAAHGAEVRAREEVIDFAETDVPKRKTGRLAMAAGIILLAGGLLWGYPGFLRDNTRQHQMAALSYYENGEYEKALNSSYALEDKNPDMRLAYLIPGNILLREGDLNGAEAAFMKALAASKGTDVQRAQALVGLGRIMSIRNQPDRALEYYREATQAAPNSTVGYLSQALVLEDQGDYDGALNLMSRAGKMAPKDHVIAAITHETRKKAALVQDQEKQARVDRLVKELIETMKAPTAAVPSDGWTSSPLTLWLMDFNVQGCSLREGEERLLASGIMDQLIEKSRVQVVERALLDKLLDELKLGTSELADRSTALSLGKILSARVIVSGQVVYAGSQTQVSLRLIETETGRIAAAVNQPFGSSDPVAVLSEKLSGALVGKLNALYPLQGRIEKVEEEGVRLNIGEKVGVAAGLRLEVVDRDVTLEVVSAEEGASVARIAEGKRELLAAGARVRAL